MRGEIFDVVSDYFATNITPRADKIAASPQARESLTNLVDKLTIVNTLPRKWQKVKK